MQAEHIAELLWFDAWNDQSEIERSLEEQLNNDPQSPAKDQLHFRHSKWDRADEAENHNIILLPGLFLSFKE